MLPTNPTALYAIAAACAVLAVSLVIWAVRKYKKDKTKGAKKSPTTSLYGFSDH